MSPLLGGLWGAGAGAGGGGCGCGLPASAPPPQDPPGPLSCLLAGVFLLTLYSDLAPGARFMPRDQRPVEVSVSGCSGRGCDQRVSGWARSFLARNRPSWDRRRPPARQVGKPTRTTFPVILGVLLPGEMRNTDLHGNGRRAEKSSVALCGLEGRAGSTSCPALGRRLHMFAFLLLLFLEDEGEHPAFVFISRRLFPGAEQ